MSRKALIVAGEASGDFYGGNLVTRLKELIPDYSFDAYGGSSLENSGATLIYPLVDNAVIGITEAIWHLPKYLKIFTNLKNYLRTERPSPVILIDYGGFNIKVASFARSIGLKTIYYIPPKVWIWNKKRAKTLALNCDLIVTIFPFEPPLYQKHGGNAAYFGHPLIDTLPKEPSNISSKTIALLPGSRPQEISKMLPLFLDAAHLLMKEVDGLNFEIPVAPTVSESILRKIISTKADLPIELKREPASEVISRSIAALSTSGTVTLEAAIIGVPQVIAYKVSRFSALVFHTFVKAPFVGLPNIIVKDDIVPELMQENCTAESMAKELVALLTNESVRKKQIDGLKKMRALLGESGAISRIANSMLPYFQ
jgi:lipid-A-disaccharide synthase